MTVPTRDQIFEELTTRVAEAAYVDPADVAATTTFTQDLAIDSLTGLSLLMKLEEDFGIRIKDAEARELLTVEDAVALVAAKLAELEAPD